MAILDLTVSESPFPRHSRRDSRYIAGYRNISGFLARMRLGVLGFVVRSPMHRDSMIFLRNGDHYFRYERDGMRARTALSAPGNITRCRDRVAAECRGIFYVARDVPI